MTVSTEKYNEEYNANGVQTTFAFTFPILANNEIAVYLRNETDSEIDGIASGGIRQETLTTDYTISALPTGNVEFVTAPANLLKVYLKRETPLLQETDFPVGGPFPAEANETGLDRSTMQAQYLQEQIDRSIRFEDGDMGSDTTIPPKPTRNGGLLGFDEDGNLSVDVTLGTPRGTWTPSTEYALRDIVYVDSGTYRYQTYQCVEAHTSSALFETDIAKWALLVDSSDAVASAEAFANAAEQSANESADSASDAEDAEAGAYQAYLDTLDILNTVEASSLANLQGQINQINWILCESGTKASVSEDLNTATGSEDLNTASGSEDLGTVLPTC